MPVINQFVVKDAATVRDDILRTIKNGLYFQAVEDPNVGPGSDFYDIATALGNELSVIGANAVLKADAQMPDTATDDDAPNGDKDMSRIAAILGLTAQGATGSVGNIVLESSASSPIAEGAELTDDLGQRFRVTTGATYANGALVPVRAISTGETTNRDEGDVLTWSSAPPYASDKASVAPGGLVNGADAEDSEAVRQRVYAKLQVPPGSGNWEQFAEAAEEATNSVLKAFTHPAVNGPSTCDIVVVAEPTPTNKSRVVSSTLLTGTVIPYLNKLPRFGYLNTTTVVDVETELAIGLSLPDAPTANPPGPGGGWLDGTPWPAPDGETTFKCEVTTVTSSTVFTVDAVTAPIAGVTHIMWLSPFDWTLYQATVSAVSGTSGAYVVTLDSPFVDIAVGCFIWPACENAAAYLDATLQQFALMGPGEKTSNPSALSRGFRHPPPSVSWPNSLGPHLLHATINSADEVASAQFFYRADTDAQVVNGSGASIKPLPPATISAASKIFIPKHIALYRVAT